jgi:hypothetical protein
VTEEREWFVRQRLDARQKLVNQGIQAADGRLVVPGSPPRIVGKMRLDISGKSIDPSCER